MPSQDAKSRQSSGGKSIQSIFRRKDKSGSDEYPPYDAASIASRKSIQPSLYERPISIADPASLGMNTGVITAIPYDSVTGSSPVGRDIHSSEDGPRQLPRREIVPHDFTRSKTDFHQYPTIMPSQSRGNMAPPQPPPHGSSHGGERGQSAYPARTSSSHSQTNPYSRADSTSLTRISSDQASIHSNNSNHRNSSSYSIHDGSDWPQSQPPRTLRQQAMTSQISFGSSSSFNPEQFSTNRPPDDRQVESMFLDLMAKRGWTSMPEQARRQMEAYSLTKKWTLVYQDQLAEWQGEQKRRHQSRYGPELTNIVDRSQEEGSPEWYVRKIMDNSISKQQLGSLAVNLRTQQIGWVKSFVEAQGQIALANVLQKINRKQGQGPAPSGGSKREDDYEREYDLVKCLKALMNNKFGADNALNHAPIIQALAGSLVSPKLNTRKLVSEVLTFLCHWNDGLGHERVIQALDYLKGQQSETGRFDAWMRLVEVSVDGRGKMGSLVGASEEIRSGGIGVENLLMEYAVASLMFVNALIDTPERDLHHRCHIRAQFISTGIKRIHTKMESFQYEVLDKQIEQFRTNEAIDFEDLVERENNSMVDSFDGEVKDLNDPVQIVDAIQSKIQNTRANDYFVSLMQHLLIIRDNEAEDRLRMFQLVDAMMSYVAMDRRLPDMDLKQALNLTVQNLLDKLYTDSEARQAREDAIQSRQYAEAALAERDEVKAQVELGADGLVKKLQKQVAEQEGIIDLMNRRHEELKAELAEVQRLRAQELQRYELEARELYLMVRDAQEAAASAAKKAGVALDPEQMQGILDREKLMERLEMQLQRAKTRAKLEGKVWQQVVPSDKLRELREKMDGEMDDAEKEIARYTASFDTSYMGSVGERTGSRIHRKPIPGLLQAGQRPPSSLIEEDESDEGEIMEPARVVGVARPKIPKAQNARLMGEIVSKVKRYDGSDDESIEQDGVTTGTTHPSLESDSPRTPADEVFDTGFKQLPRQAGPVQTSTILPGTMPATVPSQPSTTLAGFGTAAPPPPPMPMSSSTPGPMALDSTSEAPPTLPGFGNAAPPPPPPPMPMAGSKLPGFNSAAPPPPPPPPMPGMPGMPKSIPGLPPPPPPPLPGGKRGPGFLARAGAAAAAAAPSIALGVARPKKKLKALHWEKVDTPQVTIWGTQAQTLSDREERYKELSRKGILDEVEKLFLAKEIRAIGKTSTKTDKKTIISSDLRKNWQISLAKFSQREVADVVKMAITCDKEILDNPVVMEFFRRNDLCDIPENVAKLMAPYSKDWTGPNALTSSREQDPEELTREDQLYLYTAFELHHYWKARMRALSLTRTYETEYEEISQKLREVVAVSNSLRDSVSLLNVLGFILLLGNFMNDANKQASGFKISSLTRLGMVKDTTNEGTLGDFVERQIRLKWSEWESFVDDISGVLIARKLNVDQLVQDARKYIDNIKNVQASLDNGSLSDTSKFHPDDKVSVIVQRSMKEARRKAEQLKMILEEAQGTFEEIMGFFGEDKGDENARRNFFGMFAEFVVEWKKSRDKNTILEETHRRNEASMQRKQNLLSPTGPTSTLTSPTAPSSPASTGAMDDLLAKLRAAKPETRDQRDRRRRARLKDRHAVRVASGQKMPDLKDMVRAKEGGGEEEMEGEGEGDVLSPIDDEGSEGETEGQEKRGSGIPAAARTSTTRRVSRLRGSRKPSDAETSLPSPSMSLDLVTSPTTDEDSLTIASRAASLLEGLKNDPSISVSTSTEHPDINMDDMGPGPDISAELAKRALMPRENSLRVRRRREGAESERERRRQRRQLGNGGLGGDGVVEGIGTAGEPIEEGDESIDSPIKTHIEIPTVQVLAPSSPMTSEFGEK